MKQSQLKPMFVDFIPETLVDGILYVSMEYRTTAHNCCCGCGSAVYLPLSPTQWRVTFDGESVWMDPSIGSWSLPCQSHYWIHGNHVRWAEQWTDAQVGAVRASDRRSRERFFGSSTEPSITIGDSNAGIPSRSRWARLRALFGFK
jgi:hypothetical protein